MSLTGLLMLALLFGGPVDKAAVVATVKIDMVAVVATNSQNQGVQSAATRSGRKHYDPALDQGAREALARLPFTSFKKVKSGRAVAKYREEASLPIDEHYTLFVKPLVKQEDGHIKAKVRIQERLSRGRRLDVVRAVVNFVPGDRLVVGGCRFRDGELAVILTLRD